MSTANPSDPFAVDCILDGSQAPKDRVSSLAVHGEKLYVGHPSGSLSIYRLPANDSSSSLSRAEAQLASPKDPSSSTSGKASLISTHPNFHPQGKQVLSLRIVPSLSLILSFSPDGVLHFNSMATLEPAEVPGPIRSHASKGVVSFEIQTSVCDWPTVSGGGGDDDPSVRALWQSKSRKMQRDSSESGNTFPRNPRSSGSSTSVGKNRPLSMFGRQDSAKPQTEAEVKLRLVTTLVVSLRRRVVILRWLDGQPFDWTDHPLLHTPRSLVFAPPAAASSAELSSYPSSSVSPSSTMVFLSYGTPTDFGLLEIPPPHKTAAVQSRQAVSLSAPNFDFIKNTQDWKTVKELSIPEYTAAQFGADGDSQITGKADGGDSATDQSRNKPTVVASSSTTAAGALFGGLTGYIGLGPRSKAPILRAVPHSITSDEAGSSGESEVVVARDNNAVFLSFYTGNPTRKRGVEWPSAVDDIALLPTQHLFVALPPPSNQGKATIQIRSASNLEVIQIVHVPLDHNSTGPISSFSITALHAPPLQSSSSTASNAALFAILTPLSTNESARIYKLTSRPWQVRLREMIRLRKWEEAVDLVRSGDVAGEVDAQGAPPKDKILPPLLALLSLDRFLAGCAASHSSGVNKKALRSANALFESAVDLWIELDLNPTKVLSIFPERIAGKGLSRPRGEWIAIWGEDLTKEGFDLDEGGQGSDNWLRTTSGGIPTNEVKSAASPILAGQAITGSRDRSKLTSLFGRASRPASLAADDANAAAAARESSAALSASPTSTVGSRDMSKERAPTTARSTGTTDSALADADVSPLNAAKSAIARGPTSQEGSAPPSHTGSVTEAVIDLSLVENEALLSRPSLEALGRFLADRRRIFKPILETHPGVKPSPDSAMLQLPSVPLPSMNLPDLTALARVVDTALFKTFLETKPALVGPLCRIENWCEVNEVEELLKAKGKHSELISLYGGKDMHDRALELLRKFSLEEDDEEEKVGPTIRYLQGLGPEHIKVILDTSKWVLRQDPRRGMEIFSADTGKVSMFPRLQVANFLWEFDRDLCASYLEHIINSIGEADPEAHDKLGLIYLDRVKVQRDALKDGDVIESTPAYQKLLQFLSESHQYRPERILRRVPVDALWEVRAVLLGRMGQHKGALSIYVERIGGQQGENKAEEYCMRLYERQRGISSQDGNTDSNDGAKGIFLLLFKLYLRPSELAGATETIPPHDISPALRLLSRHPSCLDLGDVLSLLPPLVPLSTISTFLLKGLQASHRSSHNARVISSVSKEYALQVDERLAKLKGRRVKVTHGRVCSVCGKRLGVSVLAVSNTGETMHYGCKQ